MHVNYSPNRQVGMHPRTFHSCWVNHNIDTNKRRNNFTLLIEPGDRKGYVNKGFPYHDLLNATLRRLLWELPASQLIINFHPPPRLPHLRLMRITNVYLWLQFKPWMIHRSQLHIQMKTKLAPLKDQTATESSMLS